MRLFDECLQDARYAFAAFARVPAFTAAAIAALAIGIGATTAVFSVVNAVLMKPLPFADPERLLNIREVELRRGGSAPVSRANFVDWQDRASSFQAVSAWRFGYFNVVGRDEPEQVQGLSVSASFFRLLGVTSAAGRLLGDGDDEPGSPPRVVISDALWRRRFGAAAGILGQSIEIGSEPYTVVGVLPPTFRFFQILDRPIDLYVPLRPEAGPPGRTNHDVNVYARLKPRISLAQAQSEMDSLYRDLAAAYPKTNATVGVRVVSMPSAFTQANRPVLRLLMAAVGALLLIACANVATLLLARASARRKEIAVRAALGASTGRLVRQLLTESVVLALLGGAAGSLVASWGVYALNGAVPNTVIGRMDRFSIDGRALAFVLVVSIGCGVVFGLAPLPGLAGAALGGRLDAHGPRPDGHGHRTGRVVVVVQLALALVLSSSALLLIRSATVLQQMPRGLDVHDVLTAQVWLPRAGYPDRAHTVRFFDDVLERLARLPDVESASAINFPPLAAQDTGVSIRVEGRAPSSPDEPLYARYSVVAANYFRTMQIPLISGRAFERSDADETRGTVIVSASMARRLWPDRDAVGRRIQPQSSGPQNFWDADFANLPLTVIGVVGDVRNDGPALQGRDDAPQFYVPYRQNPALLMHLVVRTRSNPIDAVPAVRRQVWQVDRNQPVFDPKSMEDVVAETFGRTRIIARLAAAFAIVAVGLAVLGVYGLLAYVVNRRTHDIGIRMALGASKRRVVREILLQGIGLGLAGVGLGLAASLAGTRLISSFLFGVRSDDPFTFAVVPAILFGVTLVACVLPARDAARIEPLVAVRDE